MLLAISSSLHAVAITPAEPTGAVASLPRWRRPSLNLSQVGFRIALFEACSAFTSRYGLHLRQVAYQRPSTPKASTALLPPPLLRLLPAGATLTGRVSHPLKIAAFPRRTDKCRLVLIRGTPGFSGFIGDPLDNNSDEMTSGGGGGVPIPSVSSERVLQSHDDLIVYFQLWPVQSLKYRSENLKREAHLRGTVAAQ